MRRKDASTDRKAPAMNGLPEIPSTTFTGPNLTLVNDPILIYLFRNS
jgi:hypothetical protein